MAFHNILLYGLEFLNIIEEQEQRHNLRNMHRHLRDYSNPFEIPEMRFKKIFRLSRELAFSLVQQLDPILPKPSKSTFVPNHLKVLLTLSFYGYGSYQGVVGEDFNFPCSQSTVCNIIELITNAIVQHFLANKIKFPTTQEEFRRTQERFSNKFGFPNVIGCIDGTHVAIISPPIEHEQYPAAPYYNRKGYTSINALIICDADLKITAINARYPGSTHDSAIWQMSNIQQFLRTKYFSGELNGWLLGDSGFPLQPWLLTPIENAAPETPEGRYTKLHCLVRNTVERLNGVLKGRFRCLLRHRCLHYLPPKAEHNLEVPENEPDIEDDENHEIEEEGDENADNGNILVIARRLRNTLIQRNFT